MLTISWRDIRVFAYGATSLVGWLLPQAVIALAGASLLVLIGAYTLSLRAPGKRVWMVARGVTYRVLLWTIPALVAGLVHAHLAVR